MKCVACFKKRGVNNALIPCELAAPDRELLSAFSAYASRMVWWSYSMRWTRRLLHLKALHVCKLRAAGAIASAATSSWISIHKSILKSGKY